MYSIVLVRSSVVAVMLKRTLFSHSLSNYSGSHKRTQEKGFQGTLTTFVRKVLATHCQISLRFIRSPWAPGYMQLV